MWPNLWQTADWVTFTEEILNGKLQFFWSVCTTFHRSCTILFADPLIFTSVNETSVRGAKKTYTPYIKIWNLKPKKLMFDKEVTLLFHLLKMALSRPMIKLLVGGLTAISRNMVSSNSMWPYIKVFIKVIYCEHTSFCKNFWEEGKYV